MLELIQIAIVGLIVGALAKLIMPGRDPGGILMTMVLGIAGALVGTYIGRLLLGRGQAYQAKWIMSIIGSLLLLLLYRMLVGRKAL